MTWTAPTGRVVRCGEKPVSLPAQTPERGGAHDSQGLLLRRVGKASSSDLSQGRTRPARRVQWSQPIALRLVRVSSCVRQVAHDGQLSIESGQRQRSNTVSHGFVFVSSSYAQNPHSLPVTLTSRRTTHTSVLQLQEKVTLNEFKNWQCRDDCSAAFAYSVNAIMSLSNMRGATPRSSSGSTASHARIQRKCSPCFTEENKGREISPGTALLKAVCWHCEAIARLKTLHVPSMPLHEEAVQRVARFS